MNKITEKIVEFLEKDKKNVLILAVISALILTALIVGIVVFKRYFSILLIVGILVWCFLPIKYPRYINPAEKKRILQICDSLCETFCYIFNKYSSLLHIARNQEFLADVPIIESDKTVLPFWAKATIGDSSISIKKLEDDLGEAITLIRKKVINCISSRTMNIDVKKFVKVDIVYRPNIRDDKFCLVTVTISNELFNNYFPR